MDDMSKREVIRFLDGIEEGSIDTDDLYEIFLKFDPLLGYFLLRYLREKFASGRGDAASQRLMQLVSGYSDIQKIAKEPKDEPMIEWFNDTYAMREFFNKKDDFVNMIIDKLEG